MLKVRNQQFREEETINDFVTDFETEKFKSATKKFQNIFNMPNEEKLVICQSISSHLSSAIHLFLDYPCALWRGRVPRQGVLYLSINYVCFFSNLLGKEITLVIKFTDIIVSLHMKMINGS